MKRKVFDIVVVGGINADYLARGDTLPARGETAMGRSFCQGPGGKGANQAVAAARLGARVAMVGRVGKDANGRAVLASLRKEGVDTSAVAIDPGAPTGVALIMVEESGEKQIMVSPGANAKLEPRDMRACREIIAGAKIVLLGFEAKLPTVLAAAKIAAKGGARVILDPAPPVTPPPELYTLLDVIRPNAGEAEFLTGVKTPDRSGARAAAAILRARGVKAVALQAGEEGDLLVWEGGETFLPRLKVKCVDATGAGDAFAAGLAVGLAEGKSFAEAGRLANAAAALATTKVGAQEGLPNRAKVEAILKRAKKAHVQ